MPFVPRLGSGSGGDAGFTHTQTAAASTWTINHFLGRKPSVTILNSSDVEIEGEVEHSNNNTVIARFSVAVSGTAICR
jgi:hypothetical protein